MVLQLEITSMKCDHKVYIDRVYTVCGLGPVDSDLGPNPQVKKNALMQLPHCMWGMRNSSLVKGTGTDIIHVLIVIHTEQTAEHHFTCNKHHEVHTKYLMKQLYLTVYKEIYCILIL